MKKEVYLKIIQWGCYVALALPIFLSAKFFYPFILPRTVIFRALIELLLIFYFFLIYQFPQYRPRINALFWAVSGFMLALILTLFLGIDSYASFLGNFERGNGVFSWLHYYAFFIILISVFRDKKDWFQLFNISIAVSFIVSLYALGQRLGLPSLIESGVDRATGTIGNAAFLASYLILSIGLILIMLLETRRGGFFSNIYWQAFYYCALFFDFLAFYLTETRGALLGVVAGFFAFAFLYLFLAKKNKEESFFSGIKNDKIKKYFIFGLIAIIVFGGLLITFKNNKVIKSIPGLGRLANISVSDTTAQTRLLAWKISWNAWRDHLLFGWGPENYNLAFNKHFDANFYKHGRGETWFDHPHNIIFDVGVTSGFVGLAAYLSIYAACFWLLWKKRKDNFLVAIALAAILVSYFVQNLFVFDVFNSYLILFLLLAYIYYFTRQNHDIQEQKNNNKKHLPKFSFGAILAFSFLIIFSILIAWQNNIKPLIADFWAAESYKNANQPKTKEALLNPSKAPALFGKVIDIYKKTLAYETYGNPEIRTDFAGFILNNTENKQLKFEQREEAFAFAVSQMKKSLEDHPENARWNLFAAKLFQGYAQLRTDEKQNSGDLLPEAEKVIRQGIFLSPDRIALHYVLIQTLIMEEKYDEALERSQAIIPLYPKMPDSYWYVGLAHLSKGNETSALKYIDQALDLNYYFLNADDLTLAATFYSRQNNWIRLEQIYLQGIKFYPKDPQWYASLATVYSKMGEKEKAIEIARKILNIRPDAEEEVEQFIKTLK